MVNKRLASSRRIRRIYSFIQLNPDVTIKNIFSKTCTSRDIVEDSLRTLLFLGVIEKYTTSSCASKKYRCLK